MQTKNNETNNTALFNLKKTDEPKSPKYKEDCVCKTVKIISKSISCTLLLQI